ncbi:GrpB family protein [Paenibacillus terreus]|uniref:GrpB family protein n=1 Tax=Paenibacillus terreus TaxID=1387834 RepID=A0ABV5BEG8_9BACL
MEDQWRISPYQTEWKQLFAETASKLRESLGEVAVRIDHIGSTSVTGLDAKPIIDIQISVSDYDDLPSYRHKIESVGFVLREENPDKTKRYFREVPGARRTHIHVRQAGSLAEQVTLVFRDYLRTHPEDGLRYASEKHRLMKLYKNERPKYVKGKGPIVWDILHRAYLWSQAVGRAPGRSDM